MVFTNFGAPAERVAVAYLIGPGTGFLLGSDAAATAGMLERQVGTSFTLSSFQGGYTLGTAAPGDKLVPNLIGQTYASGTGSLTGAIDEIDPSNPAHVNPQSLVANVNSLASNGRGTIGTNPAAGLPGSLDFYVVSPGSVRAISADSNPGNGHPEVILLDH